MTQAINTKASPATQPHYLTGDGAAIRSFLDKFDVRIASFRDWIVEGSV